MRSLVVRLVARLNVASRSAEVRAVLAPCNHEVVSDVQNALLRGTWVVCAQCSVEAPRAA